MGSKRWKWDCGQQHPHDDEDEGQDAVCGGKGHAEEEYGETKTPGVSSYSDKYQVFVVQHDKGNMKMGPPQTMRRDPKQNNTSPTQVSKSKSNNLDSAQLVRIK